MRIKYLSSEHIVAEAEPHHRTIKYGQRFHISFPYLIFTQSYAKMADDRFSPRRFRVNVSKTPLESVETPLYVFPFPNSHMDGTMCMPQNEGANSPQELLEKAVRTFWSSPFKYYVYYFGIEGRNSTNTLSNLQKLSNNDPNWWKSFLFPPAYFTLSNLLIKESDRYESPKS